MMALCNPCLSADGIRKNARGNCVATLMMFKKRMLLKRGMGNGEWGMGNGDGKLKMGNGKLKMGN